MATAGAVLDIESLTATHERLCRRLRKLDRNATCGMVAGLMFDAGLQGGILRLEVLAHLAAAHCDGHEEPSAARIRDFLNDDLARGSVWRLEDPSEDVFVSNITTGAGDFRILEGTWEANAAYTQSCLSALNSAIADGHEWAQHGMRQANALLAIGEAVAERAGLRRYQAGEGKPRDRFRFDTAKALRACAAVTFTEAELRAIGVEPFDLLPFDFSRVDPQLLRNETINWTSLERRPVSRTEDGILVLLPTAIGAAVRRRALELARDNQAGDAYEGHLTEHQFLGAVGDAVRGLDLSPAAPPWSDVESHCVVQLCRFDAGAYCQVIFVPDRPDDVIAEGFRSVQDVSGPVRRLMTQAAAECSARDDYLRGMTLLVFGGQGRGVVADHGRPPDDWQIVGLGYDDLSLLASAGEIDALRIFRILEQEDQLARRGIQLFNPNGFMNLYGMVEEQDFTLLPEQVDHSAPSMIQMGTDHLSKLRIRIRQALDKHSVARPSRGYRAEVQRPSALPLFEAASSESAFVSVDDLRHGHPAVAIEGSRTMWWLTVEVIDPITAGSLPFRVWDMAQNWLIPLAPELEIHLGEELPGHVEVVLTFGRIDEQELLADEGKIEPPNVSIGGGTIRISCAEPYLRSFGQPGNQGDRWMVRAIASGAAGLANQDTAACADAMERKIVKDDAARHLHVFNAATTTQMVIASAVHHPLRKVQPEVRAWAEVGLASVGADDETNVVRGLEATKFLAGLVDDLWASIRTRLKDLDRANVIEMALRNHHAVDKDRNRWRTTAAAVLSLHPPEEGVRVAINLESERAEAGLCSRVLAEMALCTSPTEHGRECSVYDFDQMMAEISLMNAIASRSDEIHHGFASELAVMPNGTLRFENDFAEQVHTPYLRASSQEQFEAAAGDYADIYRRSEPLEREEYEEKRDAAFDAAFLAEYGVDPLGMADMVSYVGLIALERGGDIVRMRRSELIQLAKDRLEIDEDGIGALLDTWSLRPRSKWNEKKPEGATARDWWPWRHARRLSLLARPIINLDGRDDPELVLSPILLDHALTYALRAHSGGLPVDFYRSDEMRSWIGAVIDERGHAFNQQVRDDLEALGLVAIAEVDMTRLGGTKRNGDVDVLAWRPADGRVFAIECKRLRADRTVGEIAERLSEYSPRSAENAKRGPTVKHTDRIAVSRDHLEDLAKVTGLEAGDISLVSALVTSSLVPMQFNAALGQAFDIITSVADLSPFVASQHRR